MLGTWVGVNGWQGTGCCCVECFVVWNHGQQPWAAWETVKGLDVIWICIGSSENEFQEKRSVDWVTSCIATQYHPCLLQSFKARNTLIRCWWRIDCRREGRGCKRVARGWYWIATSITDLDSLKSTLDKSCYIRWELAWIKAFEIFVEVGLTLIGQKEHFQICFVELLFTVSRLKRV